ncbi:MAG: sigma-70 family RNA polymerase sigma factor [Clostridia bacterium]|nr:sigma-70 family RNA polymerase sigma factor [Clostridia bacterium]
MDKQAFAERVVEQTDRMYRIAWTLLRNDDDCRDAMQEAALRAWEKRYTLREEAYFATWLTRILINECHSIQRKRKRVVYLEEVAEPAVQPRDMTLSLALQALPEKLRLPLVMHSLEGMTYDEIAQALRISKATITGRIQRAKQRLKKELEV